MSIPEGLKDLLIRHEGVRLKPYLCPADKRTIGIGHNYDANPLPDVVAHHLDVFGSITPEMADQLLEQDIIIASDNCHKLYRDFDNFSERRRWALIDFMFNVGLRVARTFENTNRAINRGDWEGAAKGFEKSLWFRQVSHRGPEIVSMIREG